MGVGGCGWVGGWVVVVGWVGEWVGGAGGRACVHVCALCVFWPVHVRVRVRMCRNRTRVCTSHALIMCIYQPLRTQEGMKGFVASAPVHAWHVHASAWLHSLEPMQAHVHWISLR